MSKAQTFLLASLLTFIGSVSSRGQTPAAPQAGCTYLTCALRVETRFFGRHLVRGPSGERVGRSLSGFGGGVDILLAGPDSAAFHAHKYKSHTSTSTTLVLLSAVAFFAASTQVNSSHDDTTALLTLTGIGFTIASIPFTLRAHNDLARSVWWYNSSLPR